MPGSEPAAKAFFDRVGEAARLARRRLTRDLFLRLAGDVLRVRVAGAVPDDYLGPLEHLACGPSDPSLDVTVWDRESTGIEAPTPEWRPSDHLARGEISRLCTPSIHCAYNIESRVLSLLHAERKLALQCLRAASCLPQYELGAPMREILAWWLARRGGQLVHAAAVGTRTGAVLLVGPGGSGKSSTAVAAARAGLRYLADDYCAVTAGDRGYVVHSVFRTLKLVRREAGALPSPLSPAEGRSCATTGKLLFAVRRGSGIELAAHSPVRALLLPRVVPGRERARLSRASAASAVRALAPSSMFQISGQGARAFSFMAALVRQLPAYLLELGEDRESAAREIDDLLRRLGEETT